jgi:Domain of unknown function (DUF5916)/Carbohydrate family 9 binding domain-like
MLTLAPLLLATLSVPQDRPSVPVAPPHDSMIRTSAVRAARPPAIDGRDDDPVWRDAPPVTAFREFQPVQGKTPTYATLAKFAYDDHNLYVFVRASDPDPATIARLLARRDGWPPGDHIVVVLDSYHDRRTGYEFGVCPSGARYDAVLSNDGDEDSAWDGVWDVATTVDSLGWTAEFRIPLSQLRYADAPSHTFGLAIARDIGRTNERVSWPEFHRDRPGITSQLGDLGGIEGISSPRRLEVLPYAVTKNVTTVRDTGFGRAQRLSAGADLKYGVTSNLTLDATVNPDFGQVEADPAVLNLGAFETFYQEKRPFFIEGNGLLRFSVNCNNINCNSEGLYYSRRIGRAPQLAGQFGDAASPTATTILGAAKLTGRLASGLSIGALDAVTQRQTGPLDRTIEPGTNYALVRATQDLRGGETGIGVIGTLVTRALDDSSRPYLRSSALVGGVSLRHRFLNRRYQLNASLTASRVTGAADAIALTQRSSVHYYQRPDGGLTYDSSRTALGGDAEQIRFGKVGGGIVMFETSYQRISPGYEVNDLGYLKRADWQDQGTWVGFQLRKPTRWYQELSWNFNEWNDWTASGLLLGQYLNSNIHVLLRNHWWINAGGTVAGLLATQYCDRCARGGPALRSSPSTSTWAGFEVDSRWRKTLSPAFYVNYSSGSGGRSTYLNVNPQLTARISSQWSTTLGLYLEWNDPDNQWYGNYPDSIPTHFTFAHLKQRTESVQLRLDYTATPTLTFQVYAEPFVSKGVYSNVRELNLPRAAAYDDRFRPYGDTAVANNPARFNYKQFRSNVVLRWEYLPGSTLYLVWTQGRQDSGSPYDTASFGTDLRRLFDTRPDNTFLVKVSHWLNW